MNVNIRALRESFSRKVSLKEIRGKLLSRCLMRATTIVSLSADEHFDGSPTTQPNGNADL